jgi:hypothetical protein
MMERSGCERLGRCTDALDNARLTHNRKDDTWHLI